MALVSQNTHTPTCFHPRQHFWHQIGPTRSVSAVSKSVQQTKDFNRKVKRCVIISSYCEICNMNSAQRSSLTFACERRRGMIKKELLYICNLSCCRDKHCSILISVFRNVHAWKVCFVRWFITNLHSYSRNFWLNTHAQHSTATFNSNLIFIDISFDNINNNLLNHNLMREELLRLLLV